MANTSGPFSGSNFKEYSTLAKERARQGLSLILALVFTTSSFAQSLPAAPQPNLQTTPQDAGTPAEPSPLLTAITIPAGTRIALVLTHPIQSRYTHRGDDVYAEITSPVNSGNEVVIPPGTFVQGKVDRLERKGSRGELQLESLSVTFPNGFVAPIAGPITLESDDGYALKDPGKGRIVASFVAPAAGLGLGALIGRAASGSQSTTTTLLPACPITLPGCTPQTITTPASHLKGIAIGSMVGLAVGGLISLFLVFNSHNFYLDVGSPVEMVLQQPLSLEQDKVTGAVRQSERHPAAEQPIAPRPQPPLPPDNR